MIFYNKNQETFTLNSTTKPLFHFLEIADISALTNSNIFFLLRMTFHWSPVSYTVK